MNGAQAHLLFNHLPVLGVVFALALSCAAERRGSDELRKAGLWAFVLAALSALPAFFSGEGAEHAVEALVSRGLVHEHEEAAEAALFAALTLGAAAAAALFDAFRRGAVRRRAAVAVLFLALPVIALLARAAHLGGLIRHPELSGPTGR